MDKKDDVSRRQEKVARRRWHAASDRDVEVGRGEETVKRDLTNPAYEDYLLQLQGKNRMLKKLREKDDQQVELERREQGFSVYVNGANVRRRAVAAASDRSTVTARGIRRIAKTAGSSRQNVLETTSERVTTASDLRAKSAPVRRRAWNPESLEIRTQQGERVQVNAPDLLSGNYEEDFEVVSVSFTEGQLSQALAHQMSKGEEVKSTGSSDSEIDELAISLEDVPELRRSLERAAVITESIDTEESDVSSIESQSSAEEVEEEVSESCRITNTETSHSATASSQTVGQQDVVVLSFSTNKPRHIERHVSSAKRKDCGNVLENSVPQEPQKQAVQQIRSAPSSRQGGVSTRTFPTFGPTVGVGSQCLPVSKGMGDMPDLKDIREALAATASETELARRKGASTAPASERTIALDPIVSSPTTQRPSSIPVASPLTVKTVQAVTEKVKQMSESQQKRLLKVLGRLEQSAQSDSLHTVSESRSHCEGNLLGMSDTRAAISSLQQSTPRSHQQETRNTPTSVTRPSLSSPPSAHCQKEELSIRQRSDMQMQVSPQHKGVGDDILGPMAELSGVEVHIEILSNWGHPNKIGLTEVQFFDKDGKRLWLGCNRVQMLGTPDGVDPGNVGALVNGKTKTTKPRFMWTCPYSHGQRLDLIFIVPVDLSTTSSTQHPCQYGISKVKIWNFNGSLNELTAGVREVRVFFGGELVWKGLISKGCGNQAFDYCTVIDMETREAEETQPIDSQQHVRSKTVTLDRALAAQADTDRQQKHPDSPVETHSQSIQPEERLQVRDLVQRKSQELARELDLEHKRPLWLHAQGDEMASRQSESRAASAKTPIWLRDSLNTLHSTSHPQLSTLGLDEEGKTRRPVDCNDDDPLGLGTPFPRSVSEVQLSENLEPSHSELRSTSGWSNRRPKRTKQLLDEDSKQRSFSDPQIFPDCQNCEAENRDTFGLLPGPITSVDAALSVVGDQAEKPETVRTRRWQPAASLEKSLQSLEQFRMSDYGRITANMDINSDSLDEFMSQTRDEETLQCQVANEANECSESSESEQFAIPELPTGQTLAINILTTWGDRHYIGLNGIEIFSSSGHPVDVKHITADPADINVLSEYDSDPRVVQNLLDGVNRTRDDLHMWLAPFVAGEKHTVCLEFVKAETVAMIRVWNYNKSRIHSYRGAKHVQMKVDSQVIFDGEIARACGGLLGGSEAFGDTILFTTDEDILTAISDFDETFHGEMESFDDWEDDEEELNTRPKTASKEQDESRPFTRIRMQTEETAFTELPVNTSQFPCGRFLQLNFKTTWGDPYYLGLTGIEVLGSDGCPIALTEGQLEAMPRDLNELPEYGDDCRVLENLVDGVNVTMSDEHMWMVPFNEDEDHVLVIDLVAETEVSGVRIWNYNKAPDDTFRGAQTVSISLDGQPVSEESTFLLRKGPGNTHFDFGQKLTFTGCSDDLSTTAMDIDSSNLSQSMPTGFVFQFQLISTWGDPYYIGMNGIEFYDGKGQLLTLSPNNVDAFPHSINDLEGVSGDVRTPDRLIDGVNDTYDGTHMWLVPVFQQQVNLLYFYFDRPVTVSMVKLWNYSKTPSRGVKEFSVLVDGLLVSHAVLPVVPLEARGILPTCMAPVKHHTILFTDQHDLIVQEENHSLKSTFEDQDFQMTNDSYVCVGNRRFSSSQAVDPALRPQTSVTARSRWS